MCDILRKTVARKAWIIAGFSNLTLVANMLKLCENTLHLDISCLLNLLLFKRIMEP